MEIKRLISVVLILVSCLSGCATTQRVVSSTDDRVGTHYPDIFTYLHYSYRNGDYYVLCVDALRQQKNIFFDGHYLKDVTYEFRVNANSLEQISHKEEPLFYIREQYLIPRENIRECSFNGLPLDSNPIKVRGLDTTLMKHKDEQGNPRHFDPNKIKKYGNPGDLFFTDTRYLIYISDDLNLVRINTHPPITPGQPAAYALVPISILYDIVLYPVVFLLSFGAIGHGS